MERNRLSISLYFGIASVLLIGGGIIGGIYYWAEGAYLAFGLILAGVVLCGFTLGVIACLWGIIDYRKNRKAELQVTLPNQGHEDTLPALTNTHMTISAQSPAPTSRRSGGTLAMILGGGSIISVFIAGLALILLALIIIVGLVGFVVFLIYLFNAWSTAPF